MKKKVILLSLFVFVSVLSYGQTFNFNFNYCCDSSHDTTIQPCPIDTCTCDTVSCQGKVRAGSVAVSNSTANVSFSTPFPSGTAYQVIFYLPNNVNYDSSTLSKTISGFSIDFIGSGTVSYICISDT